MARVLVGFIKQMKHCSTEIFESPQAPEQSLRKSLMQAVNHLRAFLDELHLKGAYFAPLSLKGVRDARLTLRLLEQSLSFLLL